MLTITEFLEEQLKIVAVSSFTETSNSLSNDAVRTSVAASPDVLLVESSPKLVNSYDTGSFEVELGDDLKSPSPLPDPILPQAAQGTAIVYFWNNNFINFPHR